VLENRYDFNIKSVEVLPDKLPTTLGRETDSLLLIETETDQKFIFHLEFQTTDDHSMVYRIGEHHGIRVREYQTEIKHFVIYLGQKKPTMPDKLSDELVYKGFELIDVSQFEPNEWISSQIPEEIILAVLGNYSKARSEAILRLILRRLREVCKNPKDLSRFTQQLVILSRLRKLETVTTKILKDMPITYDIEKDGLYLQGMEKGEKKGEEKGMEKGKKKGVQVLLKTTSLSIKEIAQLMEVSEDFVKAVQAELEE
ncbi:MAG: hypothetical protein AAF573_03875, partial [Bacteroidota bacterium]